MRVAKLIFSLFFLFIMSCKKDIGKGPSLNYEVFTVQNSGLPSNFTTKIAIDNQSNIWIGTFDKGLIKYDGSQWTVYNTQNSMLPGNSILSLAVDPSDNVWIGTQNGLASLNQQNWTVYNSANSPLMVQNIFALASDATGRIWVGGTTASATGSGLYSFDGTQWQFYNQANSLLPNNIIAALATDKNNNLWVGTGLFQGNGGLLKLSNGVWEKFDQSNSPIKYNDVNNISISSNNNLLLSSPAMAFTRPNIAEGYLQEFDGVSNWKDLSPYNPQANLTNRVTTAAYDRKNHIWVATSIDNTCNSCEYALSRFDGQLWTVYSSRIGNFPRSFISDIKADKDNNIWVAAGDVGLIKISQ